MTFHPGTLAAKVLRRLARLVWLRMDDVVAVVRLDGAPPGPARPVEGAVVRVATEADVDRTDRGAVRSPAFRERLRSATGVVAEANGALLGHAWITWGPRGREGDPPFLYAVTPPAGTAYVFDVEVAPAARGRGIGLCVVAAALDEARRRGARRVVLTHDRRNAPMTRLVARLGFTSAGVLRYRRLFGLAWRDVRALDEVLKSPSPEGGAAP